MRRSTSARSSRSTVRGRVAGARQAEPAAHLLDDVLGLVIAEVVLAPEPGGLADHLGEVAAGRRLRCLTARIPPVSVASGAFIGAGLGGRIGAVSHSCALRILSRRDPRGARPRATFRSKGAGPCACGSRSSSSPRRATRPSSRRSPRWNAARCSRRARPDAGGGQGPAPRGAGDDGRRASRRVRGPAGVLPRLRPGRVPARAGMRSCTGPSSASCGWTAPGSTPAPARRPARASVSPLAERLPGADGPGAGLPGGQVRGADVVWAHGGPAGRDPAPGRGVEHDRGPPPGPDGGRTGRGRAG